MATPRIQLQLYRTTGTGPPESLQPGELAFSEGDRGLHIGLSDGSIYTIPLVTLAQLLGQPRDWSTIVNTPTGLSGYGITLQLSDIPPGINYQTLTNRPDISALDELLDYPDLASFPVTGESQKLYIALDTGLFYRWAAGTYHQLTGRAAEWGEISGTVDDQGDLKAKLDGLQAQIAALQPQPGAVVASAHQFDTGEKALVTNKTTTGLQLTLTPKASSNKVRVCAHIPYRLGFDSGFGLYLYRNGVQIADRNVIFNGAPITWYTSATALNAIAAIEWEDAPGSTAPQTYSVWARSYNGNATLLKPGNSAATLTLEEIFA